MSEMIEPVEIPVDNRTYSERMTYIVPVGSVGLMKNFAAIIGESLADLDFFEGANYTDGVNEFCVRFWVQQQDKTQRIGESGTPDRPEFDRPVLDEQGNQTAPGHIDLAAAQSARGLMVEAKEVDEDGVLQDPTPAPNRIVFTRKFDPHKVIKDFGLVEIQSEPLP